MTSTADLIRLLDIEAEEFAESTSARTTLGIAVRFREKESSKRIFKSDLKRLEFLLGLRDKEGVVWTHDANRRRILDSLVKAGGEPFGWIRVTNDGSKVVVDSAPFPKLNEDPTARIALRRICRLDPQRLLDCVTTGQGIKEIRYF
jgi:hypothetical protein